MSTISKEYSVITPNECWLCIEYVEPAHVEITQYLVYEDPANMIPPTVTGAKDKFDNYYEPKNSNVQSHISSSSNPHSTTKEQVGLGNVDNTSDSSKPISTATQAALDGKQTTLTSGVTIKTINGSSVLGTGDLVVSGATSITEVEIDFGSVPIKSKKFTITDVTVIPSNKINVVMSYANPSDGEEDSAEWFEDVTLMARAGTGQIFVYANSPYKDLNGKLKILYIKG